MDWHPVISVQQQTSENDFCHFSISNIRLHFGHFSKTGKNRSKWWPDDPVTRTWKMTQMTHWPGDPMTQFHVWSARSRGCCTGRPVSAESRPVKTDSPESSSGLRRLPMTHQGHHRWKLALLLGAEERIVVRSATLNVLLACHVVGMFDNHLHDLGRTLRQRQTPNTLVVRRERSVRCRNVILTFRGCRSWKTHSIQYGTLCNQTTCD